MTPVRAAVAAWVLGFLAVEAVAQTSPLASAVRDAGARGTAVWLSYRVPIVTGGHSVCFDQITRHARDADDLRPAAAAGSELIIYARVDHGVIDRVRAFTPDCQVDSGTTPIVQVAGVTAADSAVWLASLASTADADARRLVDPILMALSLHADRAATDRLVAIARDDMRPRVRGQALFWLAQRAGDKAAATIAAAVDNDPETEVKKRAVFALSQLPKDEGVPKLIEVARTNRNPAVRKQAIFWLGQSNDPRAVSFFEEILRR